MRQNNIENKIVALIEVMEQEFHELDFCTISDHVIDLIFKNKDFHKLSEVDQFDYLVDSIIEIEYPHLYS